MNFKVLKFIQRNRVKFQNIYYIIVAVFSKPSVKYMMSGAAVLVAGMLIRIWASGFLQKQELLCTKGPYSITRNPLYLGSFFIGFGISIASSLSLFILLFPLIFAVLYIPTIYCEEKELSHFLEFEDWKKKVPVFFPKITLSKNLFTGWSKNILIRNGEHKNILLLAIIIIIVILFKILTGCTSYKQAKVKIDISNLTEEPLLGYRFEIGRDRISGCPEYIGITFNRIQYSPILFSESNITKAFLISLEANIRMKNKENEIMQPVSISRIVRSNSTAFFGETEKRTAIDDIMSQIYDNIFVLKKRLCRE